MLNKYPDQNKLQGNLKGVFEKLASFARTRIARSATSRYMRDVGIAGVGTRRSPDDAGPLRRVTGRLSRSITGARDAGEAESIFELTIRGTGASIIGGSEVPYARVHEEGFNGSVTVPTHTRTITQAFGRPIAPTTVTVGSFVRYQNISARPFLGPAVEDEKVNIEKYLINLIDEAYNESHV